MPDARDELAESALAELIFDLHITSKNRETARAILASGVLANLRADAWDEGHDEGRFNSHGSSLYCTGNPYRKSASDDVSR